MTWEEALEIVVAKTGVERYRWLCSEDNPSVRGWDGREDFRRYMVELATGQSFPPLATQIGNLFRSARLFAKSGFKLAPRDVRRARLAICQACPRYDHAQGRCLECGCANSAKVWIAADKCPLTPPKWESVLVLEA